MHLRERCSVHYRLDLGMRFDPGMRNVDFHVHGIENMSAISRTIEVLKGVSAMNAGEKNVYSETSVDCS